MVLRKKWATDRVQLYHASRKSLGTANLCLYHSAKHLISLRMISKYTAFRCPDDLLAKAKIEAESQRRSLSNYLITIIEKDTQDVPDIKLVRKKRK